MGPIKMGVRRDTKNPKDSKDLKDMKDTKVPEWRRGSARVTGDFNGRKYKSEYKTVAN